MGAPYYIKLDNKPFLMKRTIKYNCQNIGGAQYIPAQRSVSFSIKCSAAHEAQLRNAKDI